MGWCGVWAWTLDPNDQRPNIPCSDPLPIRFRCTFRYLPIADRHHDRHIATRHGLVCTSAPIPGDIDNLYTIDKEYPNWSFAA